MTLTQAAVFTKKGIVIFIGLIILGIIFKVIFDFGYKVYRSYYPPPENIATIQFGKLPKIIFPSSKSTANYTYTLDTKTGGLPQNPNIIKIYFIPQTGVSLLSADRSKALAQKLGFEVGPENLSSVQVRFKDQKGSNLTIDLPTGNFSFDRSAELDPNESLQNNVLPEADALVNDFKTYLGGKDLLNDQLKTGRSNVVYDGPSRAEATKATVSLWPQDIDELPIVTPDFAHGLIKVTMTRSRIEPTRFSKLNYYYWPIEETTFSTYPLKSTQTAFEQLKAGGGYFSLEPPSNQASITSVSLAYYQSTDYSPYLQPVYVFAGSNFAAYVPAIDSAQIQ